MTTFLPLNLLSYLTKNTMHHSLTILALTLAGLQSGVFASPLPQYSFPDSNALCAANANPRPEYENTSERRTTGEPIQIGASYTPNGENDTFPLNQIISHQSYEPNRIPARSRKLIHCRRHHNRRWQSRLELCRCLQRRHQRRGLSFRRRGHNRH